MEKELMNIVDELFFQQYSMNLGQTIDFFEKTSMAEYIVLNKLEKKGVEKIYLKDLANNMYVNKAYLPRIVGKLRDCGYVEWRHDGNGDEGTYIMFTERGKTFLQDQEQRITAFYSKVVKEYGYSNTKKLMDMLQDFREVMQRELERGIE